ncbi:MAG: YdjY domain-containing protein [Thermoguttaceae bacterium]|nr:YdjY domain-containing protein [Thermoguttaceae bacterium]MDW8077384.1 YdjY domain-containing protein [Thermoguttaceae bacterium]
MPPTAGDQTRDEPPTGKPPQGKKPGPSDQTSPAEAIASPPSQSHELPGAQAPVQQTPAQGASAQAPSLEATAPPQPHDAEAESRPLVPERLPTPLVPAPQRLQQLHPHYPVWIDPQERVLIAVGEVCQQDVPLELFACSRGSKEHESIVSIASPAYVLHAGLLALGAESGAPVQFHPEFRPASGDQIEVTVRWKDESGAIRECLAQDWVQDISAIYQMFNGVVANQFEDELHPHDQWDAWKAMSYPWVFAGSQFVRDDRTGREIYLADEEGVLICVANFPAALLDIPIESTSANAALLFRCFAERIPPIGTEVTLLFRPAPNRNQPPPLEEAKSPPSKPSERE